MSNDRRTELAVIRCLALAAMTVFAGCAAQKVSQADYVHMLCIDADGGESELVVTGSQDGQRSPTTRENSHDHHVELIAKAFYRWRAANPEVNRELTFVIHGGLVSMGDAISSASELIPAIRDDIEPCELEFTEYLGDQQTSRPAVLEHCPSFPVFINWETGIGRSYLDHLLRIRNGRSRPVQAFFTSPLVLLADFGRALMRLPLTLTRQAQHTVRDWFVDTIEAPPPTWSHVAWLDPESESTSILGRALDLTLRVVPGALRPATTPLLDGAGLPAYDNMRRRARVLFVRDDDFDRKQPERTGALSKLMRALGTRSNRKKAISALVRDLDAEIAASTGERREKLLATRQNALSLRDDEAPIGVSIIAHSMGSIVANELVRSYGDAGQSRKRRWFDFKKIVFMGAACTIKEFADTTLVYIRRNPNTRFYNLCLHPEEEANDRYAGGILPYGSLLDWIDSFITQQSSELDFTLGKWNNVMRALAVIDYLENSVRRRIVVRGFPELDGWPRDHDEFNDKGQDFWNPAFWDFRIDPRTRDRWRTQLRVRD